MTHGILRAPRSPRSRGALSFVLCAALLLALSAPGGAAQDDPPEDPQADPHSAMSAGEVEEGETASVPLDLSGLEGAELERLAWFETEGTRAGEPFAWRLEVAERGQRYDRFALTYPSPAETEFEANATVHGRWFLPRDREGPLRAVVVLHWKGGAIGLTDVIGDRLARAGYAPLMLYLPHYGPRSTPDGGDRARFETTDLDLALANYRQAVLDIRRAVDWLAARPEVDGDRIGLLGVSLGAIVGSLAAGVDPRFDRTVLVVGGADVPAIVMHPSRETRRVRRAALEAGLTLEGLREVWRPVEPLTYAARIPAESVLMVNTEDDSVIPRECTEALQRALRSPEMVWYPGGHHALLAKLLDVLERTTEHFDS